MVACTDGFGRSDEVPWRDCRPIPYVESRSAGRRGKQKSARLPGSRHRGSDGWSPAVALALCGAGSKTPRARVRGGPSSAGNWVRRLSARQSERDPDCLVGVRTNSDPPAAGRCQRHERCRGPVDDDPDFGGCRVRRVTARDCQSVEFDRDLWTMSTAVRAATAIPRVVVRAIATHA